MTRTTAVFATGSAVDQGRCVTYERSPVYSARRTRLRTLLAERDQAAALITKTVNVRYLSGFTGSNGALLLLSDRTDVLGTDGRYADQAAAEAPDLELVVDRLLLVALANRLVDAGVGSVAVETHHLTLDQREVLRETQPRLETTSLARSVEQLRRLKDDGELELLRTAAARSCEALDELFAAPLAKRTEREVASELERLLRKHGTEGPGFETIVASGPNSAIPHHRPTNRVLERGDLVKIDFGGRYDGYHADCTRTVSIGPPADWQEEIYQVVRAAQASGRAALAPGADLRQVDAAARTIIEAAGYGDRFTHGLGHGIGLEVHEDPFLGKDADGRIEAHTPVTIEPGIYLPGRGGVRIEDTLVVRDGAAELLTPTTKELVVLD